MEYRINAEYTHSVVVVVVYFAIVTHIKIRIYCLIFNVH